MHLDDLRTYIRDVPDFPKPGILFKDITPLLRAPAALAKACELLAEPYLGMGITTVAGIESRGFIFGSIVSQILGVGFIPIRKAGKLPWTTRRHEYVLEYGANVLEIHYDALTPSDNVLIVDDLLATGGTLGAAAQLVRGFDANLVACATVIELEFLDGRKNMSNVDLYTLLKY